MTVPTQRGQHLPPFPCPAALAVAPRPPTGLTKACKTQPWTDSTTLTTYSRKPSLASSFKIPASAQVPPTSTNINKQISSASPTNFQQIKPPSSPAPRMAFLYPSRLDRVAKNFVRRYPKKEEEKDKTVPSSSSWRLASQPAMQRTSLFLTEGSATQEHKSQRPVNELPKTNTANPADAAKPQDPACFNHRTEITSTALFQLLQSSQLVRQRSNIANVFWLHTERTSISSAEEALTQTPVAENPLRTNDKNKAKPNKPTSTRWTSRQARLTHKGIQRLASTFELLM
ncbi:hypothetical protein DFJ73DRAFT_956682 [Zopfochytrium polystomum]|nr:hypothetical protein DFJ73DRAFT_956682 [Zopfochytrium polystomum]